jgi:site-specific recombinase XerD
MKSAVSGVAARLRQMAISEFAAWLGRQTNNQDRPFQEHTIRNYTDAAKTLDRWMPAEKIDEDLSACDTVMLNRFFAAYLKTHTAAASRTARVRGVFPFAGRPALLPCDVLRYLEGARQDDELKVVAAREAEAVVPVRERYDLTRRRVSEALVPCNELGPLTDHSHPH